MTMKRHPDFYFTFVIAAILFNGYQFRMLTGYKFPVYTTDRCPTTKSEWDKRSSALKCGDKEEQSYACFPNENFTELLEFCYPLQYISIPKDMCLYLSKRTQKLEAFDCVGVFPHGCPTETYSASTIFEHPSCVSLGNGCFLADPSCEGPSTESNIETTQPKDASHNEQRGEIIVIVIVVMLINVLALVIFASLTFKYVYGKKTNGGSDESQSSEVETGGPLPTYQLHSTRGTVRQRAGRGETPRTHQVEESNPLLSTVESKVLYGTSTAVEENKIDLAYFDQWRKKENDFGPTKGCEEVRDKLKNENLIVVTGLPRSGKSAIIHHIGLEYKNNDWCVKPINTFQEIKTACKAMDRYFEKQTLFIFDDPFGDSKLNEESLRSYRKHRETLTNLAKAGSIVRVKFLFACSTNILYDERIDGILKESSRIVDIKDNAPINDP